MYVFADKITLLKVDDRLSEISQHFQELKFLFSS